MRRTSLQKAAIRDNSSHKEIRIIASRRRSLHRSSGSMSRVIAARQWNYHKSMSEHRRFDVYFPMQFWFRTERLPVHIVSDKRNLVTGNTKLQCFPIAMFPSFTAEKRIDCQWQMFNERWHCLRFSMQRRLHIKRRIETFVCSDDKLVG